MTDSKTPVVSKTIAELEVVHNNLDEQIKVYENYKTEMQTFQKENENREVLLKNLQSIIDQNNDFEYLINPLKLLTGELKNSILFNKYIISDETVKKLKIQRDKVKEEILKNDTQFIKYQLDDKAKAIVVIEDCISTDDENFDGDELENKKKRASAIA